MSNIQKQSRRVRILFQSLFVLLPFFVCYYWLTVNTQYDFLTPLLAIQNGANISSYTTLPLSMMTRILASISTLLLCSIVMYGLHVLIRLFRRYEQNEIFSFKNTKSYQKLGYSLFYWAGASVIYGALMSVVLSFNNPPGERVLAVTLGGVDILTVVLGFVILIISWVMKEGFILADENAHTI